VAITGGDHLLRPLTSQVGETLVPDEWLKTALNSLIIHSTFNVFG
jgi:hypothetical protein